MPTDNFWQSLPQPFFILAPMEDVTDVVFRQVIARAARPDAFFTEFTNTNSWCSPKGRHSTKGRLTFVEAEQPIVAHIWGDQPEYFSTMSIGMAETGFRGIDLNMGCPTGNVATRGKGAGLIRRPELAAELIAASKAGGLPVSVKTRLGYSALDEANQWLSHLLRQDITNLSIHLRTKKEMSKVDAHYELIPEIVRLRDKLAPETLLTINGDITSRQHGEELLRKYPGVNGVMIGRGVFQNPYAFSAEDYQPSRDELLDLLYYHLDLFDQYREVTGRPFQTLKRFFKIYIKEFEGAADLRSQLMQTTNTAEVRQLLNADDAV